MERVGIVLRTGETGLHLGILYIDLRMYSHTTCHTTLAELVR